MVSLRQHIDLSACQNMLASVAGAYASLLKTLDDHAPESIEPAATDQFRRRLARVREKCGPSVDSGRPRAVEECSANAAEAVERYSSGLTSAVTKLRSELENTSKALQDVLVSMAANDGDNQAEVEQDFQELEALLETSDPRQLKAALQTGLRRLHTRVDDLKRQKDGVIAMLRDEVKTLQKNIDKATARTPQAPCAALTREEFEAFVEGEIEQGASFCLVYCTIANLSRLQRYQGPAAVTEAIDTFAGLLRQFLPGTLALSQFSAGEFCCLEPASYEQTSRHIAQLTRTLGDPPRAGAPLPRFMMVSFTPADGPERLLKRFHDMQRQSVRQP